jgi:hypothetical protein
MVDKAKSVDAPAPKYFEVKLKAPVTIGGTTYLPRNRNVFDEATLKEAGDAVESSTEVK